MTDIVRFSLMWVNDPTTHSRPMSRCRMILRDAGGDALGQSSGGLTCGALYLDQVDVQFRPTADIGSTEFQSGDNATRDWRDETTSLYVRTSPGRRSVCYTLGAQEPLQTSSDGAVIPRTSLIYTTSLHIVPEASTSELVRTYRPLRDLPIATQLTNVSDLTVDLLWPLLQGKSVGPGEWFVPDYRLDRVLCDFTAHV